MNRHSGKLRPRGEEMRRYASLSPASQDFFAGGMITGIACVRND
jgi:hypothetical protein